MAKRQLTPEQYVDRFFSDQGITQPLKPEVYWKRLTSKFGNAAEEFGDCIAQRESGVSVDPYPLKNTSLAFSDAITSQSDSPRLKKFFSWFLNQGLDLAHKKILDLGCDNGLFACFVAKTFPTARIVGIDPCAEAIAVATQRARRAELTNVSFFIGTLDEYLRKEPSATFDIVTSLLVFHELLAGGLIGKRPSLMTNELWNFSLALTDTDLSVSSDCDELRRIAEILTDDGRFLSLDRWGGSAQVLRWVRVCEAAGLRIILQDSFMLRFKDSHRGVLTMPVTIFVRGGEQESRARAWDILSLYSYPGFLELTALQVIKDQEVAELLYESLCKEHLYVEEVVYNDGSGIMMTYVGVAAGVAYVYKTTNRGYRELSLLPSIALCEKVNEIEHQRAQSERHACVKYTKYNESLHRNLGLEFGRSSEMNV